MELLVVIVIIGILARIALPSFRGLGQGNVTAAANRQLLDDLALARLTAINERTTVYLVFVPVISDLEFRTQISRMATPRLRRQMTNLYTGQLTSYALFANRTVGSQPGRITPRYLTEWKVLPEGLVFNPTRFVPNASTNEFDRSFTRSDFPFPSVDGPLFNLPYIAFNSRGQVIPRPGITSGNADEILSLYRGTLMYARDNNGNITGGSDLNVPRNGSNSVIRVNWLTGRAAVLKPELP